MITQAQRAAYVPAIVWSPEETGTLSPWQADIDRSHLDGCGATSGVLIDSAGYVLERDGTLYVVCELSDGRYVSPCAVLYPYAEDRWYAEHADADALRLYYACMYDCRSHAWIDVTNLIAA